MSPELEDATRAALMANLMLVLKRGNRRRTAVGLLAYAQALVEDDPLGRKALAQITREWESLPREKIETGSTVVQFARRQ